MIGKEAPVCLNCKHFNRNNFDGLTCTAFPSPYPYGIPDAILVEGDKHLKPLPQQGNNIIFEPNDNDTNFR